MSRRLDPLHRTDRVRRDRLHRTDRVRRRRRLVALALAVATIGIAAGCSRPEKPTASKAFCRAADDYNTEVERTKQQGEASAKRQAPLVDEMARHAPKSIKADAQTFADALRALSEGDTSVVDDPDIKSAVDDVNRFANQACNVYERDSSGGGF